jgi:hypothetical protein
LSPECSNGVCDRVAMLKRRRAIVNPESKQCCDQPVHPSSSG